MKTEWFNTLVTKYLQNVYHHSNLEPGIVTLPATKDFYMLNVIVSKETWHEHRQSKSLKFFLKYLNSKQYYKISTKPNKNLIANVSFEEEQHNYSLFLKTLTISGLVKNIMKTDERFIIMNENTSILLVKNYEANFDILFTSQTERDSFLQNLKKQKISKTSYLIAELSSETDILYQL